MSPEPSAAQITKASKSNLALAFIALPKERRADITSFYAFCRLVDDIADSPSLPTETKRAQLVAWRRALDSGFPGEPALGPEIRRLIAKYRIDRTLFHEVLNGVEMDLEPVRFNTFEDLRLYCYRVASAVGLVSIEIFGYRNPDCKTYALELGLALQLTNIIRDVGRDFANGERIYLPLEDLERFGYPLAAFAEHRQDQPFESLMTFQADRAAEFYARAVQALPPEDRPSMAAAEIMRRVYWNLLEMMRRDRFRVFEKRYSLGRLKKLSLVAGGILSRFLAGSRLTSGVAPGVDPK